MSRTTHHVPWRRRTDACPHNGNPFTRYRHPRCCAAVTEHSQTTLRRPRGAAGEKAVVEVTTGFAAYSRSRGSAAAGPRAARGRVRTTQRDMLVVARAAANAALSEGDWDALDDIDDWVAPPLRTRWSR